MSTPTIKPVEQKKPEENENKSPEERQQELLGLSDEQLISRFVDIADRGFASIRLNVPLPPDVYGEWAPNDPGSIAEYEQRGFIIDNKYATKHGLHSDGTGKPIVGDVIHMVMPMRLKEMHDKAAKVRFDRTHRVSRNLPEEIEFESQIQSAGLQTRFKGNNINQSVQESVTGSSILNTVKGT